jgi:hypothetical protein
VLEKNEREERENKNEKTKSHTGYSIHITSAFKTSKLKTAIQKLYISQKFQGPLLRTRI